MCYALPGPRCSGHAAENLAKAKTNLEQAKANHEQKIEALSDAKSDKAKAEFFASKKLLAEAEKAVEAAQKEQDAFEVKHQAAKDAYKLAERDWYTSPDGIQELRDEASKAMSEGRTDDGMAAEHKANQFQKRRDGLIRKMKAEEAKKNANLAPAVTTAPEFAPMEPMSAEWDEKITATIKKLNKSQAFGDPEKSGLFKSVVRMAYDNPPQSAMHKVVTTVTKFPGQVLDVYVRKDVHPETLDYMADYAIKNYAALGEQVAANKNIASSTVMKLADSRCPEGALLHHYDAVRKQRNLDQYVSHERSQVRTAMAMQTDNASYLSTLGSDQDEWVRHAVAKNDNTPTSVLDSLASDSNRFTRYESARHRNTSTATLERLSRDEDETTRYHAARNKNLSVNAMERLFNEDNERVRVQVLGNPSIPRELLERAAKSRYKKVKAEATRQLGKLQ